MFETSESRVEVGSLKDDAWVPPRPDEDALEGVGDCAELKR